MLFFEVQAVYQRQTGEDNPACVKETYMVESLTPSSRLKQSLNGD